MQYDFDRLIDRRGTDSSKWQFYEMDGANLEWPEGEGPFGEDGLLPLWVADMDFPSPEPVVAALVERARHGLYGYTGRSHAYDAAVVGWLGRRHGWEIDPGWITNTPGVVTALYTAVQAFTDPGERVLIQPPVYHPFTYAIERNDRIPARVPLRYEDDRYRMDFDRLEAAAREPDVRLAILCSPHNPVGRVWSAEELRRFGEICAANGIVVIADEVFGDLVYPEHVHTIFATAAPGFAQNTVVCTSPSKTFNLPGLKTSNIVIPNEALRKTFNRRLERNGVLGMNAFGSAAVQAAYTHGEDWLAQVLAYAGENYRYLVAYLGEHLPAVRVVEPEGTYLVWVDFRPLGVGRQFCRDRLMTEARVYLDDGSLFGPEGEGFARFNIACPRGILAEALERIVRCLS
jgi:cystathionine beta-lyase